MIKKIPCIIDTDPGVDDAFAILYAAKHPLLDLKAITTVFGNVSLNHTFPNAKLLAGTLNQPIIVSKGHYKALVAHNNDAGDTHGQDGFGGKFDLYKHLEIKENIEDNAVKTMVKILSESEEKVILFPIGPLTNIASLILCYPEFLNKIKCISLMGGAFKHGNRSMAAEFNILMDPEAAKIVFESHIPILMTGLDITDQAIISDIELKRIRDINNDHSEMLFQILDLYASHDKCLHDPLAIMAITDPDIMEFEDLFVDVETAGHISAGQTIADYRSNKVQTNAKVAMKLNHKLFMDRLIDVLSK